MTDSELINELLQGPPLKDRYTPSDVPAGMTPWYGGDCPIDPDQNVTLFWADGDCEIERAGDWRWDHHGERSPDGMEDIVGYQPF